MILWSIKVILGYWGNRSNWGRVEVILGKRLITTKVILWTIKVVLGYWGDGSNWGRVEIILSNGLITTKVILWTIKIVWGHWGNRGNRGNWSRVEVILGNRTITTKVILWTIEIVWGHWSNWGSWGRVEVVPGLVEVILGTLGRMRGRVVGLFRRKLGLTLIPYISNKSRVFIGNRISDNLGTSIRKIYTILTSSLLTVTSFVLSKV